MTQYTKRAEDALDLIVVIDFYMSRITKMCKGAVAFSAHQQVARLQELKFRLETELVQCEGKIKGVFSWLEFRKTAAKLKADLAEINKKIVHWVNSVYRYFAVNKESQSC